VRIFRETVRRWSRFNSIYGVGGRKAKIKQGSTRRVGMEKKEIIAVLRKRAAQVGEEAVVNLGENPLKRYWRGKRRGPRELLRTYCYPLKDCGAERGGKPKNRQGGNQASISSLHGEPRGHEAKQGIPR